MISHSESAGSHSPTVGLKFYYDGDCFALAQITTTRFKLKDARDLPPGAAGRIVATIDDRCVWRDVIVPHGARSGCWAEII